MVWAQTPWPMALRVLHMTLPGSRVFISSAMRLLNAKERIGRLLGSASAIMTSVEVLAAPAKAFSSKLSVVFMAASIIASCSAVGFISFGCKTSSSEVILHTPQNGAFQPTFELRPHLTRTRKSRYRFELL